MQKQLYLSCIDVSNAFQVFSTISQLLGSRSCFSSIVTSYFNDIAGGCMCVQATKILLLQIYAKHCCYRFVWNIITCRKKEKNEVLRTRDSKKDEPKAGRRRNVRECRDNPVERERGTRKRIERNEEKARSCSREGRLNSTRGQCLESEIGPNQFQADKTRVVVSTEVFA